MEVYVIMKKTIIFILMVILGVSLSAQSQTALTGKYMLTALEIEGVDLLEALAELGLDTDDNYIELLDGGKFRMVMFDDENEGVFKFNGNSIIMTVDGEDLEAVISGGKITIEEDGNVMVFQKGD